MNSNPDSATPGVAFIGGGNMASAILGGLLCSGHDPAHLRVVEPDEAQAATLREKFHVRVDAAAGAELGEMGLLVWAVKPQVFPEAVRPCAGRIGNALQLSVMAGIRSEAIARATGSDRVVRAMPNTPALIGEGIAGLFARPAVTPADRARVEAVLAATGQTLWVDDEAQLDAVTALSGSGPAYVFYLIEAMTTAATALGLADEQGRRLALATLKGATALAAGSPETPATLRARVTSKGGTTHAALSAMEADGVGPAIVRAIEAAARRARELGDEFKG